MKLATLRDGSRDGQLAVVARDLKTAHLADGIAPTLQAALDDWAFIAPQLMELSQRLNGAARDASPLKRSFEFDPAACMAPLPRAFQWISAPAYPRHVELLCEAHGAAMPEFLRELPLMQHGAGDSLCGPCDDIVLAHEAWGIDFSAGVAAISGDVPMGATADQAHGQIRLLTLVNQVTLRNLAGPRPDAGSRAAQVQCAALNAFAPVALTPDELGDAWKGGAVQLPLRASWNGKLVGQPGAGVDLAFNFAQLLAHACHTRAAGAGCVIGSGPVSNRDTRSGYTSIAEQRAREMLADGVASTPYMLFGDTIRIEMLDAAGKSLFGAIAQSVRQADVRRSREAGHPR